MTTKSITTCDVCGEEITDYKLKVELRVRYYQALEYRTRKYSSTFIDRDYHIRCYRVTALPIIRNTPVDQP